MPVNDRSLALAADIERRDGDIAAALDQVVELSRRADGLRRRSEEIQRLLESTPGELARLDLAEAEARDSAAAAALALAEAEQLVESGGADDGLELVRELAGEAAAWHRHVVEERTALLETEGAARTEIAELARSARDVAASLTAVARVSQSGREPPGDTLVEVADWGRRVQAALFVVRGQLEAERDRLIREANELAGAVLGEQLAGSSVALVRRRLEEALRP